MKIAIFLFLASFASITCWLLCRAPADPRVADTPSTSDVVVTDSTEQPVATDTDVAAGETEPVEKPIAMSDAEQYIKAKLEIVIPVIDFQDASFHETIDFLRLRIRELDPSEEDSRKGLSFRVLSQHTDSELTLDADIDQHPVAHTVTLRANNVSASQLLTQLCQQAGYRWEISDHGVVIAPLN